MSISNTPGGNRTDHHSGHQNSRSRPRTESFRLATYFPYLVRMFYRDVSDSVRAVYAPVSGLSPAEWRTMVVLNEHAPLTAGEIVARSSMDKVNVSRAVAGLQRRELLARHADPGDRRRVLLRLTARGQALLRELIPGALAVEQRLLGGLDETERATLIALMERVRRNALAEGPPPNAPPMDTEEGTRA